MNDDALTEDEIVSHFRAEADNAKMYYNTDLADRQANALEFYDSEPFGDEEDGLSQYIEPVVEQTVDDMTVDIMEAFVSGDRVVEFEANDEAGELAAEEANEAVQYLFMRKQRGYRVTLDWLQSGLVEILGVLKVTCTEERKRSKDTQVVPDEMLSLLDPEAVLSAEDNGDGSHTVVILNERTMKRFETHAVPSEEMRFSPRMKSFEDRCYKAHVVQKTVSELIEMGFDRDSVESLPTEDDMTNADSRENARWKDNSADVSFRERKGSNRLVMLHEEYDHLDIDGDGISELVRVFRVGDVLLSVEEWEEQPFVGFCPYPRAHRLVGKGLAEKVMPDQRVESIITRQMLDGLYSSNSPRRWLPDESVGETTIDDLLVVRPGAIIRGKGLQAPVNMSENFDLSNSLNVLERFSQRRQSRTGILELGKGMDKDALNDTASGQKQLMAAGEKQIRYVARNFGEAMAEAMLKLMRLLRLHGEQMTIKVGKQFKPIDPSKWPEEMDFSIRVGLGTNGKEKRIAHRMMIAQLQAEAFETKTGLVTEKHLYNTAAGIIRDVGLGEPGDFFADPEGEDFKPPEQGQDPEAMKVQAEMQMQKAKMEGDMQIASSKLDMTREEGALKLQLAREQAEADAQLARERAEIEAQLARDKADFEADLAREKMAQELELSQQRMALEAQMAEHKASIAEKQALSKNRPGGDLDK
jgi:hypothetical protein